MQFVKFETRDGNPKGVAVFHDQYSFKAESRVAFDQRNLELRIANLKQQSPRYDLSCEMAVLAEMKKGGAG